MRRAQAVRPICDLQIEYSLISRGIEREILPACRELGVGITAYGVLSGPWTKDRPTPPRDFRAHAPRFASGNVDRNLAFVEALRSVADSKTGWSSVTAGADGTACRKNGRAARSHRSHHRGACRLIRR